ncbi:HAD-IA family hydrolase (plasmid) [Embleya sp. NBC_00888]|uniref:HAD family hydrolase n=1 Tax=Embleya sp. NBC_00888 TaxID=2975960 RepID=UPI002F910AB8|nr:HAD-IA family hydrolase [Embleya sp. NBC_00888]
MSRQRKALVLDFDGLVADTEVLWLAVLRRLYRTYFQELPYASVVESVGGTLHDFDPFTDLSARCGSVDASELEEQAEGLFRAWMAYEAPLPGVRRLIAEARLRAVPLAIASSSREASVVPYLDRFGLRDAFSVVVTADDVVRVKPAPDLYLLAARRLGTEPEHIVAFEDSGRGVRAAKAAGALCVAVPHVLTRSHDFDAADIRLDSLALCDLEDLLSHDPGKVRR